MSYATDATLSVWQIIIKNGSIKKLKLVRNWRAFSKINPTAIAVIPYKTAPRIWVGSQRGGIRIFDSRSFSMQRSYEEDEEKITADNSISSLCYVSKCNEIWCSSRSKIFVYTQKLQNVFSFDTKEETINELIECEGKIYAIAGPVIHVWSVTKQDSNTTTKVRSLGTFEAHSGRIRNIHQFNNYLFTCSFDKSIIIWDKESTSPIEEVKGQAKGTISAVIFAPPFHVFACSENQLLIYLFNPSFDDFKSAATSVNMLNKHLKEEKEQDSSKYASNIKKGKRSAVRFVDQGNKNSEVIEPEMLTPIWSKKHEKIVSNCVISNTNTVNDVFQSIVPAVCFFFLFFYYHFSLSFPYSLL